MSCPEWIPPAHMGAIVRREGRVPRSPPRSRARAVCLGFLRDSRRQADVPPATARGRPRSGGSSHRPTRTRRTKGRPTRSPPPGPTESRPPESSTAAARHANGPDEAGPARRIAVPRSKDRGAIPSTAHVRARRTPPATGHRAYPSRQSQSTRNPHPGRLDDGPERGVSGTEEDPWVREWRSTPPRNAVAGAPNRPRAFARTSVAQAFRRRWILGKPSAGEERHSGRDRPGAPSPPEGDGPTPRQPPYGTPQ